MTTLASIPVETLRASMARAVAPQTPQRWPAAEVEALYALPFMDLLFRAQQVHRAHFDANEVQLSTLLSIKTGGCAEDRGYCPQSSHFDTGVEASKLMLLAEVVEAAQGAKRFCMGAAWRSPKARDMERVTEMVREVRAPGLETCMTLDMLEAEQAQVLREAGLDYYNHNLDSAPEFYASIISTRTEALQALCFAAGANSIFYGDKLLTTSNPQAERDRALFERLGLKAQGKQ